MENAITTHHKDAYIDLQRKIFTPFLLITLGLTWGWMWVSSFYMPAVPTFGRLLAIAIAVVCFAAYALRQQYFQLSVWIFLCGISLLVVIAHQLFNMLVLLYFLGLVSLLASILTNPVAATLWTSLFSLYVINSSAVQTVHALVASPLIVMWACLIAGLVLLNRVKNALDVNWSYQEHVIRQMNEAREHRAKLMQLTKTLQETQQELQAANTQLRHARDVAEESRRLKAQFAANVSHELRTPINLVVGFTEMIVTAPESYGVALPGAYRADMHAIYRNAKHLQSLINDVLDVSQIEAGHMVIVKEECNARDVINEAAALARALIESKRLNFTVEIPEQMSVMWLDRTRMRQILLNLLSNSARFTDSGSITLKAHEEDGQLVISVTDTGIGIQESDLHRVFEEFHQLEESVLRRQGGTGLGLTLSKRFVEMHGGRIRVESRGRNKGATFVITLPVANTQLWTPTALSRDSDNGQLVNTTPEFSNTSVEPRYFALLDDDPAIQDLFSRYMSHYRAVVVETVEDAERIVENVGPTALVLGNTGQNSVLRQRIITALENKTPIISCPMPSGKRALLTSDAIDYLVKPVSFESLKDAIERVGNTVKSILIIDDERDVVRMYSRMIRTISSDYEVLNAFNGYEGLELMRQRCPDIVILDLQMPDVDGFAVVEHMKADPRLSNVPVVFISGKGTSADAITPFAEGEITITKPGGFQPLELIRCIESLMDSFTPSNVPVL